jgi:flagellin-like protein
MKNEMKNEEAVSPVIATILMVAITVVLAGVLYVWASDLASSNQSDGPSMYVLTAADHSDDVEDDAGLMTLAFDNDEDDDGDLDWALVQIEIIKDGVPVTCGNPDLTGQSCSASQHGGEDPYYWENGETIIITSNNGAFCLEQDCTLTVRIKYNGDVIMMAAVDLI